MGLSTKEQLDLLAQSILEAEFHFQIWEELQVAQSTKESIVPLKKFTLFFLSTRLAHFTSTVITCYRLFETRRDTVNFANIKKMLLTDHKIDLDSDADFKNLEDVCKVTWKKMSTLRNKSLGHLSHEASQSEIYRAAGIKPSDISDFIANVKKLVNHITYRLYRSTEAFNLEARSSTKKLFHALRTP